MPGAVAFQLSSLMRYVFYESDWYKAQNCGAQNYRARISYMACSEAERVSLSVK